MGAEIEAAIRHHRLVAILRSVPLQVLPDMARALLAGGLPIMELPLSGPDALAGLYRLRQAVGDSGYVGAGTVVTTDLAERALAAGAQFFVTPHVLPEICALGQEAGVCVICGALTPTEIALARTLGSNLVKLFPASAVGPDYVRALMGPYPDLELLAVGGVDATNLQDYLEAGAVGAGIGGALTSQDWSHPDLGRVTKAAAGLAAIVARKQH